MSRAQTPPRKKVELINSIKISHLVVWTSYFAAPSTSNCAAAEKIAGINTSDNFSSTVGGPLVLTFPRGPKRFHLYHHARLAIARSSFERTRHTGRPGAARRAGFPARPAFHGKVTRENTRNSWFGG